MLHACAAQREGIFSRQGLDHTPKPRRTRPCAVHKRALTSTAGGAGGRRARGEADGQQMGYYGGRACPGDGLRGPARLRGVRRVAARAGLQHCQTARSRVLGRWYSRPFDDLASLLPSTALLNHTGKRRGRFWGQRAGHTGLGISAASWVRLNSVPGLRLRALTKCSSRPDSHEQEELLLVTIALSGAWQSGKRAQSGTRKDCGRLFRRQPSLLER